MSNLSSNSNLPEENTITFHTKGREVFKIGTEGEIYWLKDQKMVRAKTDKQLGLALAQLIKELTDK